MDTELIKKHFKTASIQETKDSIKVHVKEINAEELVNFFCDEKELVAKTKIKRSGTGITLVIKKNAEKEQPKGTDLITEVEAFVAGLNVNREKESVIIIVSETLTETKGTVLVKVEGSPENLTESLGQSMKKDPTIMGLFLKSIDNFL